MADNSKQNQMAMEQLFNGLYNFVAPVADSDGGMGQRSFFTQMKTGLKVSELEKKDYAQLADRIPEVQRDYAAGNKVSDVYQKILSAVVPEDQPSKEQQEKYDNARKLLAKDSEKYAEYKEARQSYQKAYRAYYRLVNDAAADRFAIQDAKMQMRDALIDFEAAYKTEIENALAFVTSYERFTPASVFRRAGEIFDEADAEKGFNDYYEIDMIPDLTQKSDALEWEELAIKTYSQNVRISDEAKKTDFSESEKKSSGWWFWKKEKQESSTELETIKKLNSQMTTDDLAISMEIAIVEIERPWFNEALLTYSEAYIPNEPAGVICEGTLTGGGIMPMVPTAFVFVRNVKIYNQFSEEEKQMFSDITDQTAENLSYGPFGFSKSESRRKFHDKISQSEQEEYGDVGCLELGEDPQIIGIISTVMSPKFPMKSGVKA